MDKTARYPQKWARIALKSTNNLNTIKDINMTKCTKCKDCKYPDTNTLYPEDSHGIPFCNSEGLLSPKSREILSRKFYELTYEKAPRTGPYA